MKNKKVFWLLLLFIAILLFILSIATGYTLFSIISLVLGVFIYKNGDSILFKEYNEKSKRKREQIMIVREASKTIIKDNTLIKKNK